MEHIELHLTDQQRQNYQELAEYLDTGITEYGFDMMDYFIQDENRCGTVACALGHAPFVLGIDNPFLSGSTIDESEWVNQHFGTYDYCESPVYGWCFSSFWAEVDNTSRGAAARIFYMLENGVPDNYYSQMSGTVPVSYTVKPLPTIEPAKVGVPA